MASLAEIRAKLLAQENTGSSGSRSGGDNAIFPFWNLAENTSATVRFLADGDVTNDFFWKERQMIRLDFPGIKGQADSRRVTVNVPCMEMWEPAGSCPVLAEVRPWFKDPSLEDMGRKYWKKRSYIFQGFVVNSDLQEDSQPENPIRRFIMGPQIFNIIKQALMDPDFPAMPTDAEEGTDFKIHKTTKGQYADYSTSNWARRERSLDENERNAIETHGLHNLNDFMPARPSAEQLDAIRRMFEASVDGQLYDPEEFGQFYRPAGMQAPAQTSAPAPQPAPAPVAETPAPEAAPAPVVETPAPAPAPEPAMAGGDDGDKPSAQDILAKIRARKAD